MAFTILALSAGVVSVIFGNGLRLAGAAEGYTRAMAVAESKIAEFTLPGSMQPGLARGVVGDIRWQTTILPWFLNPDTTQAGATPTYYRISVIVAWGGGEAGQSLALETIRLLPRVQGPAGGAEATGKGENPDGTGADGSSGGNNGGI